MRCKSCGNDVKSDFKYCPFCASRLVQDFNEQFADLEPPVLRSDPSEKYRDDVIYGNVHEAALPKPVEEPTYVRPEPPRSAPSAEPPRSTAHTRSAPPVAAPSRASESARERRRREAGFTAYRPDDAQQSAKNNVPQSPPNRTAPFELSQSEYRPKQTQPEPLKRQEAFVPPSELPHTPSPHRTAPPLPLPDLDDDTDQDVVEELISFSVPNNFEDFSDMPHRPAPKVPIANLEMDVERSEAAPYVSMKPDVAPHVRPPAQSNQPGTVFKVLLLIFIILVGVLTSIAVYWFAVASDWFNSSSNAVNAESSQSESVQSSSSE